MSAEYMYTTGWLLRHILSHGALQLVGPIFEASASHQIVDEECHSAGHYFWVIERIAHPMPTLLVLEEEDRCTRLKKPGRKLTRMAGTDPVVCRRSRDQERRIMSVSAHVLQGRVRPKHFRIGWIRRIAILIDPRGAHTHVR